MSSHISAHDGSDGSENVGAASAAKGVGNTRKGCARRSSSGRCTMGRTGPLVAGSSICHNGDSGRARAMAEESEWCSRLDSSSLKFDKALG